MRGIAETDIRTRTRKQVYGSGHPEMALKQKTERTTTTTKIDGKMTR